MKGLIGFFDILGYQNFLENNSASDSAIDVLRIINEIPQRAREKIDLITHSRPGWEDFKGCLKHLVFSDTIVFTLAYSEEANSQWIYRAQGYISMCSSILVAEMFNSGLPIRGALHEGEFIVQEHCLAGKAIVEAYKLCESLNFAGVVCTKELSQKMIDYQNNTDIHNDSEFIFNYLSPMKDGSEMKLAHVNWLGQLNNSEMDRFEKDPDGYVLVSFWAHKKDCPQSVDQKIHNTAKIMRKMLQNLRLADNAEAVASKG